MSWAQYKSTRKPYSDFRKFFAFSFKQVNQYGSCVANTIMEGKTESSTSFANLTPLYLQTASGPPTWTAGMRHLTTSAPSTRFSLGCPVTIPMTMKIAVTGLGVVCQTKWRQRALLQPGWMASTRISSTWYLMVKLWLVGNRIMIMVKRIDDLPWRHANLRNNFRKCLNTFSRKYFLRLRFS